MKVIEFSWEFLKHIGEFYHHVYRNIRKIYKWPPDVFDRIDLNRILRIHNEVIEDSDGNNDSLDEDDF